jgi:hypothetical protein
MYGMPPWMVFAFLCFTVWTTHLTIHAVAGFIADIRVAKHSGIHPDLVWETLCPREKEETDGDHQDTDFHPGRIGANEMDVRRRNRA